MYHLYHTAWSVEIKYKKNTKYTHIYPDKEMNIDTSTSVNVQLQYSYNSFQRPDT